MTLLTSTDVDGVADGFHVEPGSSMSLRAEANTEDKWAAADLQAIFARSWQWVCHVEKLASPGSYVSTEVAGMPVAVVRGRDGDLRAFYNVCKHRAHELVSGAGTTRNTRVPHHAWTRPPSSSR